MIISVPPYAVWGSACYGTKVKRFATFEEAKEYALKINKRNKYPANIYKVTSVNATSVGHTRIASAEDGYKRIDEIKE